MTVTYTELYGSFAAAATGAWTDEDLFTDFSIPKGAVAEILIENPTDASTPTVGVRVNGSALSRWVVLHEAEGLGDVPFGTHVSMYVQTDANGVIEYWSSSATVTFRVMGYFQGCTYREKIATFQTAINSEWVPVDLKIYGVPRERVCDIWLNHDDEANNPDIGVRTRGSALVRKEIVHEAEGGGNSGLTYIVRSDASGYVEVYTNDTADSFFTLFGYFSYEVDFVERWQQITLVTAAAWTDTDLTAYLDVDGRIVHFVLSHNLTSYSRKLGIRTNGSALARLPSENEAESNAYAGFGVSVKSDANGIVEYYINTAVAAGLWMLDGYFKDGISRAATLFTNVRGRGGDAQRKMGFARSLRAQFEGS